jgi:molybdate/tungstate transport system substrate-binding protein
MCIVYHEASRYSEEINQDNWYEILMKDDVVYGRSDPNADPCGYRAVLGSQLAEKHYKQEDFSAKLLAKDTKYIRPKEN